MNTASSLVFATFSAVLLAACATPPSDYGASVRTLEVAQTANPQTRAAPSDGVVTGVDPDYADAAIKILRESASKPQDVKQALTINVSGQK